MKKAAIGLVMSGVIVLLTGCKTLVPDKPAPAATIAMPALTLFQPGWPFP